MKSKTVHWMCVIGIAAAVYGIVRLSFQFVANSGLDPLVTLVRSGKSGATNLIVVVHAYGETIKDMEDVRKAIEQSRPEAEIEMVEYPAGTWSNADCCQIA